MTVSLQKILIINVGLILISIFTLFYLNISSIVKYEEIKLFGVFAIMQLLYIILSWHNVSKSYFDSYIVFMLAFYIFSLGQPILEVFELVTFQSSLLEKYSIEYNVYIESIYISLLFIMAFHFGAISSFNKKIRKSYINYDNQLKAIRNFGKYGILITSPFYIYTLVKQLIVAFVFGYQALYDSENLVYGISAFYMIIANFYVPSLICLLIYSEISHKSRGFVYILTIVTVVIPPLLIGGRTNAVIVVAIMMLIYSIFNKISLKNIIAFCLIIFIGLFSLNIVRELRGSKDKLDISLDKLKSNDKNIMAQSISEMGWSMYPLSTTMQIVPSGTENYRYGSTYLWSLTTIMPNLFWDIHPGRVHSNLSAWLQKKKNLWFGPGYLIIAEAYINFGWFGFIFMYLYSYVLIKFFQNVNKSNAQNNLISFTIGLILLWFSIRLVRNNFSDIVRYVFYYTIPIFLIIKKNSIRISKKMEQD